MAASIQSGNFGSYSKPATSSTVDFPVNVSAGSDRKLVVWCVGNAGTIPYISSIKLGAVDIPPVIGCDISSGSAQVKAWVLDNPPIGAGTVHVVDGWNHIYGAYFWAVVDDAGTPTPVTGAEWANAALSLTASTPAGGIALGVGYAINGGGTALDGTTGLAMVVPDGTAAGKGSFGYTTGAGLGFTFGAANSDKVGAVLVFPRASVVSGPTITGPATFNLAENATAGPTFTTDIDLGSGYPQKAGADAALFNLVSTGTRQWQFQKIAAGNYEAPDDAGANRVYDVTFAASAGVTASCAITLTNVAEPPNAPVIGTATAGDATVTINGTPGAANGGPSVTSYTAVLSPGSITKAGASLPIVFGSGDGVVNGTAYTGTLTATNSEGTSAASAASNSVTPVAAPAGPTINTQPTTQTAKIGAAATWILAATSSGGALVRQWKFNGGNVGSNSNSYTRTGIVLGDHGATVLCNVADDNGNLNTNSVSLVVAVTLVNTVPAQSGTEGDSFSLNLANYFAGGLSRTYALHSGTLPTGCSLGGSTVSGTLGSNGSGSFVIRATDANGNIEDTGTIPWTINAPGVGASFTTPPLEDNTTGVWANEPVDFIAAFDRDTLQLVALILGGTTNSDGQVTGTHGNLTPGTLYRWGYRLANGATNLPDLGAF